MVKIPNDMAYKNIVLLHNLLAQAKDQEYVSKDVVWELGRLVSEQTEDLVEMSELTEDEIDGIYAAIQSGSIYSIELGSNLEEYLAKV